MFFRIRRNRGYSDATDTSSDAIVGASGHLGDAQTARPRVGPEPNTTTPATHATVRAGANVARTPAPGESQADSLKALAITIFNSIEGWKKQNGVESVPARVLLRQVSEFIETIEFIRQSDEQA